MQIAEIFFLRASSVALFPYYRVKAILPPPENLIASCIEASNFSLVNADKNERPSALRAVDTAKRNSLYKSYETSVLSVLLF
jgi:hypothetical protein